MLFHSHLSSTHLFPVLLLVITTLLGGRQLTTATCHVDDQAGLLAFKSGITADPSGMLASWTPGSDCCKWSGISCGDNNRVTTLSLYGQLQKPNSFLSGTISPSLSKLPYLDGIYLQDLRNISGPFPNLLFGLPNLEYVYIENSKLSGQIPGNIGDLTRLGALSLAGNRFSGPIPSSISKLTQLGQLKLGSNLLAGPIPLGIQQLKNLTLLSLDTNQLTGTIPDFFSSFIKLRTLALSRNKLSGKIPASISTLAPILIYLELGHNDLTGKIPDFLGKFHALDTLDLSWNRLTGTVPKSFGNLTKIFNLDLSHNFLVDPFPEMKVKGIESLDLSYNGFHLGEIPKWVTSSTIIYSLNLAKCGIKMKLDDWKPVETYFYDYIDLSDNQVSGSPVQLLNRTDYLVGFWVSGNQVRFNMQNLKFPKTLKELDLSRNLVFGKVPKAISGLQKLNVSHNHLCGSIPATKFPASAFVGNDCLCGAPLPPCKI
ncbi:DNA-damage-repair/toleration protein [Actinidia chinensis var. chinensis]|uniref:DNA-damage-repair/toleration protein n=1 Tax=Actinidia chinensis var. chinensis TaxID=1590841 RepID=A0A2R6RPA3_ACTCC|nr:DNA-damage-repair/toleration protein [Actinidia chinensis var. chinensis]